MDDLEIPTFHEDDESWLFAYADLITNLLIFLLAILSAMEMSHVKMQRVQEALSGKTSAHSLKSIAEDLKDEVEKKGYGEAISANLEERGVIVALNSGIVFPLGSEAIQPEYQHMLGEIMGRVKPYAQSYAFAVEGHTDALKVRTGGKFASNWDLASARALVVREHLEGVGIPRDRLHTEAYADTKPLTLADISAEERQGRQRRVMIRIY